ncbi:hypothetical protein AYO40_03490 [Planctomycetaceae bacterium SCGC AG-212-D15]|nr:hypothetical protein AYO40_03490 [Planctomycetaceae bacterium SCGC AG-212-D15]
MDDRDPVFLRSLFEETISKNRYIAQTPTEKQAAMLYLAFEPEIFWGGSCAGGKSSALLMAALQFVSCPGYAACLFRKTLSDLEKPGALIARSHEWLQGTPAKWHDRKKTWMFPSGATLTFSYLDASNDKYNHRSSEYQYCGFDELTDFAEDDYRFLFSRLRRLKGVDIPIRMRSAGNPGGRHHEWVKQRFITEGDKGGRIFIPARIDDNPHIDKDEYVKSLDNLDPITKAQLLAGDWTVRHAGSMFKREWFKVMDPPGRLMVCRAWDLAASIKKQSDYTVGVKMGRSREGEFYVLDVLRRKLPPEGVERVIQQTAASDGNEVHIVLPEEPGAAGKMLTRQFYGILAGYPIHVIPQAGSGDKFTRAQPFASQAGAGRVFICRGSWISDFLDELESFPAGGHDDIVDSSSEAFHFLTGAQFYDLPFRQPEQKILVRVEERVRKLQDRSSQRRRGLFGR